MEDDLLQNSITSNIYKIIELDEKGSINEKLSFTHSH